MSSLAASPEGAKPFLTLDGVSLRPGSVPIHWEILTDQQWAVVGPNGSGKSTLMRVICGQLPARGGRLVYHFSRNGGGLTCSGRGDLPQDQTAYVAFDSQKPGAGNEISFYQARWNSGAAPGAMPLAEYLSEQQVWQVNPYLVSERRSDPAAFAAQKSQVIDLLGLEALLDRTVLQLSNGERRKALLARALLRNPRLLILDNPFAGLDASFRVRLKQIVSSLMSENVRLILVTNDRDEIPVGVTNILLMENCEVTGQETREAMLQSLAAGRAETPQQLAGASLRPVQGQGLNDRQSQGQVLVHMNRVNVTYDGLRVLDQVHWTVCSGEKWAVLGPNGAGKTTLLSLILGDNPQGYANDVTLFGRRRGSGESIWEIKRQIGWVAPELHLYYPNGVSCLDVVCSGFFDSVGCYQRCSPLQRETAVGWMQRLGVSAHAGQAFAALSEGQQRMILIARALVKRPVLLVLDEPCQGLDAANRDRVVRAVEALGDDPRIGLIYVTHRLDALPRIITHVLRLEEGRIISKARVNGEPALYQ